MTIRKTISQGYRVPRWYGVAWLSWRSFEVVCYPIPLNVVIRWLRCAYIWLQTGDEKIVCNPRDAYHQGFTEGRASMEAACLVPQEREVYAYSAEWRPI